MPEGSWRKRIRADVDKVIGAMEELARSPLRFEELARALFQDDRVPDNVKQDLLPEVHRAITAGVRTRLRFLRDNELHRDSVGRLVYNAIIGAAVSLIDDFPAVSQLAVADALGVDRKTVWRARQREAKLKSGVPVLDPERARRKDAFSDERIQEIQDAWARFTQPSPEIRIAHLDLPNGTRLEHAVHFLE
eukprot:SAG25_NODE_6295_length_571_cov_1.913136_1_plen_190_part_11